MEIEVIPHVAGNTRLARCITIYDWTKPVDPAWLALGEQLFSLFDDFPEQGTGSCGGQSSHGSYRRVHTRLSKFLETGGLSDDFDIRLLGKASSGGEGFFPSNLLFAFSCGVTRLRKAMFAVDESVCASLSDLLEVTGEPIFTSTGNAYGGAFEFPVDYDPEGYLSSIAGMPKGAKWGANEDYAARITRWRDNIWKNSFQVQDGYFREIYPINFLLESHLSMPFRGNPLYKFAESVGILQTVNDGQFRWDVPADELRLTREQMENSGLILSAACEPLRID